MMNTWKSGAAWLLLSILLLGGACTRPKAYRVNEGWIFGTTYRIVYDAEGDKHEEIKALLQLFNASLSTFDSSSVITRFNRSNTGVRADSFFRTVVEAGLRISEQSEGAFDMTVAPLVNAWGFGFEQKEKISPALIDSLRLRVGMAYLWWQGDSLLKGDPRIMLDASAIAKGYGVDVVASFLAAQGCTNYLVEIGGEVVTGGLNAKGLPWRIGVDRPAEQTGSVTGDYQFVLGLSNRALATSGNYRNYYVEDGKKYAHTIDPRSGYPASHSLLSATVLAPTCMEADAWATAFMVLGVEASKALLSDLPELDVCFIYHEGEADAVYLTDGFRRLIVE